MEEYTSTKKRGSGLEMGLQIGNILIEQLENRGLLRGEKATLPSSGLTSSEIRDICVESGELTALHNLQSTESTPLLSFTASKALSGGSWPCGSIECRTERAQHLAEFAALYSDRVYFPNPFAERVMTRSEFYGDIEVIAYLRPLIEAGLLVPITSPAFTGKIAAGKGLAPDVVARIEAVRTDLSGRYRQETDGCIEWGAYEGHKVAIRGPDELVEHEFQGFVTHRPVPWKTLGRKRSKSPKGKQSLTGTDLEVLGLTKRMANEIVDSVLFEAVVSELSNSFYLAEADIHLKILQDMLAPRAAREKNKIVFDYLQALLPYCRDLTPRELLKLRSAEGDAFLLFRNALSEVVERYRKNLTAFTARDARELHDEIIRPRVADLEIRIRNARRKLFGKAVRKALAWSASVAFGVYSGLLSSGAAEIATAVGGTAATADLLSVLLKAATVPEEVRNDRLFFLWKLQRSSVKRQHAKPSADKLWIEGRRY